MKHKLTRLQQLKGIKKAVRSDKTPPWLKPSMRAYARKIEAEISTLGLLVDDLEAEPEPEPKVAGWDGGY